MGRSSTRYPRAATLVLCLLGPLLICGCDRSREPVSRLGHEDEARLLALGYLSEGRASPAASTGVTIHESGRAQQGLNLIVSAHAPQALLLDMDGRRLHSWQIRFEDVFPEHVLVAAGQAPPTGWRRAHLLEDGGLLAMWQGFGLVRLDSRSRVLWKDSRPFHHDLDVAGDGAIHVLLRRFSSAAGGKVGHVRDQVLVLAADGTQRSEIDLVTAFEAATDPSVFGETLREGDVLHTNTVERMGSKYLISALNLDAVAVVDPVGPRLVSIFRGEWSEQHHPTLLPSGNIVLLDNRGRGGKSQILEIEPREGRVVWRWPEGPDDGFQTPRCGSLQVLQGGNLLVTESEAARAFELTRKGEIVWEYRSPERAGAERDRVAMLYDVVRVPTEQPWLEGIGERPSR